MIILAIESSCDETAVAILKIEDGSFEVLANEVSSQIEIHQQYGGVVPEVAARRHVETIVPILAVAMKKAGVSKEDIDVVGVVRGPGLNMSLIVGIEAAKTLAMAWGKPLVPVDHMRSHILANFLDMEEQRIRTVRFPALCLVVSGGHTELVLLQSPYDMEIVGATRDDAVGEAFDKVAKIIGLGYPGGPAIAKAALEGNSSAYNLPRPMLTSKDFDFSFSGLKTAVRLAWAEKQDLPGMSASFQQACIDVLIAKTLAAAEHYHVNTIMLGGGVSANKELRRQLREALAGSGIVFHEPDMTMTTDNALMAAVTTYYAYTKSPKQYVTAWKTVAADPNLVI